MSRGRGYSRGNSYRGSSSRGHSSWGGGSGGRGGYSPRGASSSRFPSSFESRSRYSRSSSDRFSARGHHHHSDDFKKPYRSESHYGRDSSHGHRSPERKRMRTDAPSSRHESSYSGYGSSSSRYESGNMSERRSFSSDRHVSGSGGGGGGGGGNSSFRRDDFRRPPPPPPPPSSHGGSMYRGRLSTRGPRRGIKLRERPPMPTRRRLVDTSYAIRKRVLTTRPSDYARRLKISRMRSAIARRGSRKGDEKEESEEEKETVKVKEESIEKKEAAVKEEKDVEIKKETKESEKTEKLDSVEEKSPKKTYIKLVCPHCNLKSLTFRKYEIHLSSKLHLMAMRKIALKQKSILAQMRMAQRNTQNELEKNSTDLTPRTNFCPLCKLNYKQRKAIHQHSDAHKNMKKFLMPYCKVCDVTFKSPMIFENHCCSIEHIKRKQRVENGNSEASGDDDNLENFTTIDSVGDGDVSDSDEKKDESTELVNVGIEKIRKVEAYYCDLCRMYLSRGDSEEMPKIMSRHCKQRLHMQRYVRYKEDKEVKIKAEKMQSNQAAEKEATVKSSESSSVEKRAPTEEDESKTEENNKSVDDDEARDDKLWADVDKDLGDIIAEAESGNKSSDEDDDSHINGERYDRFKLSEKNGDKLNVEGVSTEANETENNSKDVTIKEEK